MGREEMFTSLLTLHQRQIFRVIYCMVHRLEDAEDLFQQTSLTMWDKFDQFESGSDFVAWASRIARFKALNLLTSRGRRHACFSEQFVEQLATQKEDTEEDQRARLKALESCRSKLRKRDQQLIHECYSGRSTIRDVAKKIGRTPSSVYDSLTRIRSQLFKCIQHALAKEGNP